MAVPLGKAGMLSESGIRGSRGCTAGIEVREVIEVTEEPTGIGVSMGIVGMMDRFGIEPIPKRADDVITGAGVCFMTIGRDGGRG